MKEPEQKPDWLVELESKISPDLAKLFYQRDGAAIFAQRLPEVYSPLQIAEAGEAQRAWELAGLFYKLNSRFYEALGIFECLYRHMLIAQEKTRKRCHKGMPLVWMSDCYSAMGCPSSAKKFIMLTLCEDAIACKGVVPAETTGVYFRLVWHHGLLDTELQKYARQMYELSQKDPEESMFPEFVLQEIDQDWMTEFPSLKEAALYTANTHYVKYLLSKIGDGTGKNLEMLAQYLLSTMPGCRTYRRRRSASTEYDLICSTEGFEVDFRSELGRYFVCECKDWGSPADFTSLAKFCRVLDSIKSRFGILFSRHGISGVGDATYAEREQLKVFQDRGMVIVVIDLKDLESVANGENFISLLRKKYEKIRLDLV